MSDDLFAAAAEERLAAQAPLAARLRPRTLDEVVGQAYLLAPGRPLRALIEGDRLTSAIFWGAPGGGPGGAGRRVFDVALEGQTLLQDLDIYAQAGGAAAAIHFTFNTIVSDGDVEIDLTASIDRPKVSAIEIRRL